MQIVINISEEDYEGLKRKDKFNDMYLNYYEKLIVHDTPLPKKHGRLIDVNIANRIARETKTDKDERIIRNFLNTLPTVIPADKED